jgi:hypothetical protein
MQKKLNKHHSNLTGLLSPHKTTESSPARTALFFVAISSGTTIGRFECRLENQARPPLNGTDARLVRPLQPAIRVINGNGKACVNHGRTLSPYLPSGNASRMISPFSKA